MEKNDQDILERLQEIIEKSKTQTYEMIKWDSPLNVIGQIQTIKEVDSIYGGKNKLYILNQKDKRFGFFDSPASLKKQLLKLDVKESDIIYVEYKGTDTYNGHTFKSFVVYKYIGGHKWVTSNGKQVTL